MGTKSEQGLIKINLSLHPNGRPARVGLFSPTQLREKRVNCFARIKCDIRHFLLPSRFQIFRCTVNCMKWLYCYGNLYKVKLFKKNWIPWNPAIHSTIQPVRFFAYGHVHGYLFIYILNFYGRNYCVVANCSNYPRNNFDCSTLQSG